MAYLPLENLVLITGGARSGKSDLAQELAVASGAVVYVLATMPVIEEDAELMERIGRHRNKRPKEFLTIEETVALEQSITDIKEEGPLVLLDCLSLFVSNLMQEHQAENEDWLAARIENLLDCMAGRPDTRFIVVTNEVGWSVVPDNRLARQFRDWLGTANKLMAQKAGTVYLCVSGIRVTLKEGV